MKSKKTGFTLVELMISMLISLVLVFACTTLYSGLKSSITLAQKLSTAQESLRGAFYLLSRSMREAQDFDIVSGATRLEAIYGTPPTSSRIYSCLGNSVSGSVDTFYIDADDLYCSDGISSEKIALGVTALEFKKTSGALDTGVQVRMKVDGMPASYVNGITFTLALRQKILLDIVD